MRQSSPAVLGFHLMLVLLWLSLAATGEDRAEAILARAGVSSGIGVVLEDKGCETALALARRSELVLLVRLSDGAQVEAARRAADAAGLYGTRIYVERGEAGRVPLADDVADLVVAAEGAGDVTKEEILRVLRPRGKALLGAEEIVKPVADGTDDWTHHYHGPDNNPQSRDRLARAPYLTQFVAEPRYAPAPQAAVAAGGRLFMAFGHVAWHEREEPLLNTLVAVNAYNGTLLWKRELKPGLLVDRSTLVATPETLYLADDASCKLLDPATGRVRDEIVSPVEQTGGTCWKWMALEGGVLYGLVGEAEPPDPVARWKMTGHGWPWDRISTGYNRNEYGWGFARTLLAFDPVTKKVLWQYQADPPIDSRGVCLKGGRIYVCLFGKYIVCLDAKTGTEVWRRSAEKDKDLFDALGPYRPGHGWIPGWKSTVYLKCTDQALYFAGPQTGGLSAVSAKDGSLLWKQPIKDLQAVIREDGLYTIGAEQSKGLTRRLDLLTGEVLATYPVSRRACTRATGSPDGILFRAYDGTTRLDLATGQPRWIAPMRPSCHVGVVIAGGRLYWVPWACDCNLQMYGVISLGPAGAFPFGRNAVEAERLERGAEAPGGIAEFPIGPADWPTYRGNNARMAEAAAEIPGKVALRWQTPARAGYEPTAPVAANGLALVGGSDGVVCALDTKTGAGRWKAYTGGAVRFPPAVAGGLALVGSGDGWAYAFEAASGRLVWRFRAAPAERRIPVFGALLSTWPVAAPVVVEKGAAYVAAGLDCFDGTHVYALELATGRIVWQNNSSGHLDADSRTGVAVQGETLLHEGRLYLAGGNAASPGVYDTTDGRCLTPPPQGIYSRAPRGRELRLDKGRVVVAGQPFYSQRDCPVFDKAVEWPEQRVTAKNATLLLLREKAEGKPVWRLAARERAAGAELWTQTLPAEPVRWGMAADAAGRIIVTLTNGQVLCYGAAAE